MKVPTLRPLTPADLPDIRRLQRELFLRGGPLPFPVMDLEPFIAYLVDYYVLEEPEGGLVAVDEAGRPVGFLTGSADPARQQRWQRAAALRLVGLWLRHWGSYDPFTRWFYTLRLRDGLEVLRDPTPPLPAHLHINVQEELKGRLWRPFFRHFAAYAKSCGAAEFGLEIGVREDQTDAAMFCYVGFHLVYCGRHHTLTALTGQPMWRIKVACPVDGLRV